ncbi:Lysylphosphatidylglycerol biosynthesis bifunctional protein LysX, partial [Bienertia sinuspersici]
SNKKHSRAVLLDTKFTIVHLSHFSNATAYCQEIKNIADQLVNIDQPVLKQKMVLRLCVGLRNADYDTVATLIQQCDPLPDFYTARSKLLIEESRRAEEPHTSHQSFVAAPSDPAAAGPSLSSSSQQSQQPHQQTPTGDGGRGGGRGGRGRGLLVVVVATGVAEVEDINTPVTLSLVLSLILILKVIVIIGCPIITLHIGPLHGPAIPIGHPFLPHLIPLLMGQQHIFLSQSTAWHFGPCSQVQSYTSIFLYWVRIWIAHDTNRTQQCLCHNESPKL